MNINEPKICTRCKELKGPECYKIYNNRGKMSLKPACEACQVFIRREQYERKVAIPELRERKLEATRQWRKANRTEYLERQRIYYREGAYKEWRRGYIEKNRDKINAGQRKVSKNRVARVTQGYVVQVLRQRTPLAYHEVPPALIKLKRMQLVCKRTAKQIKP